MAAAMEAVRNRLPSGYDERFVNAVEDEVLCLICHLSMKEPVQTRCGHRFCKECLEEHFRRQGDGSQPHNCPADREGLDRDRDVFPDKAMERKILSFAIRCPSRHCDWKGELRNKEVHLASCLFTIVSCTNKKCHINMQRRNFNRHMTIACQWRIIKCELCSKPHPHCKMQDHIVQCNKSLAPCPNNCGGSISREMIANHTTKDCSLTFISCPYVEMGCKRKVQRKEVESHLTSDMRPHLDLACVKLNNTETKLNNTEIKLNKTEAKLNKTEVKLNKTEAKLNKTEVKLNNTQEKLDTRMFIWKINNFSEILRQAKTGEKCIISSTPFYTARAESYGYKLKVDVYPDGDGPGKNTHLSVFIFVMKGEYDAILPWPFKKKLKFTLIDQQEDPDKREDVALQFIPGNYPESFAKPTKEHITSGHGYPEFISHEELHSRRYIVDDTLFLQVEVGPSSS